MATQFSVMCISSQMISFLQKDDWLIHRRISSLSLIFRIDILGAKHLISITLLNLELLAKRSNLCLRISMWAKMDSSSEMMDGRRDENIRYIRRYIFDIFDIGDVRHDIDEYIQYIRYIVDISVFDRYIVEISGLWHTRVSLIFR